jgi:uncharacterized membrane protein YphA (DoxX/SURF4 family)
MALASAQGLALIRIAFGVYFIVSAFRKTTEGWLTSADGLTGFLERNVDVAAPLYASFLDTIVRPHAPTFAQLVVLGEWVAGLTLLLGLFTRLGGIVGAWLVLNYMVAKGLPNDAGSNDRLFFVACIALAFAASGLAWGLDGAWRPVLEGNPLTRWLSGLPGPRTRRVEALTERWRTTRRAA